MVININMICDRIHIILKYIILNIQSRNHDKSFELLNFGQLSVSIKGHRDICFLECKRIVRPLSVSLSSSITISPTHARSFFFFHYRTVTVALRLRSLQLLNYESPPSFTFIYRCTILLDLPPRFSRLLFLFFVPPPSNLLFRREIPFRLLSASVRSVP